MDRERMERALARIEAAASRVERAVTRPSPIPQDDGLAERHANLRAEVSSALNDLDALIGTLEI